MGEGDEEKGDLPKLAQSVPLVYMWVLERDVEFVGECELPNEMTA